MSNGRRLEVLTTSRHIKPLALLLGQSQQTQRRCLFSLSAAAAAGVAVLFQILTRIEVVAVAVAVVGLRKSG
jgi:hypothetical protein